MNDAKGHASNLLILSLATVLVGAGILSWSLTQSSFFKESPRLANSLAEKNVISESIMTNQPLQDTVKIKIPDIQAIQTKKPDSTDEATIKPVETALSTQKPKLPVEETLVAEKIILPETQQNEIAASTPKPGTTEIIAPETPENEETSFVAEIDATDTPSSEAPQNEIAANTAEAPPSEKLQSKVASIVPETVSAEITPSEAQQNEELPAPTEMIAIDTLPSETPTNEETPIMTEAPTEEIAPSEAPATEVISSKNTTEITPNTEAPDTNPEITSTTSIETSNEDTQIIDRQKNGWIYVGQYEDGKWIKRGLELPSDKLPDAGNIYKLIWGTNVRSAPPGKRKANGDNLGKNIDYLPENREIEITSIKNSGKTGHIWLEIKY